MTLPKFAKSLAYLVAERDTEAAEAASLKAELPKLAADKEKLARASSADGDVINQLLLINTRVDFIAIRTRQLENKFPASDAAMLNEINHVTASLRKLLKARVEVLIERDVKHLVERHGFDENAARQWADALAQGTGGNATVSPVRAALGKAITRTEGMIYNIPDAARNLLNQMEYIEQEAGPLA